MESAVAEDPNSSSELFKQLVEREGKAARNVVNWTLPAADRKRVGGEGGAGRNGGRKERKQPHPMRISPGKGPTGRAGQTAGGSSVKGHSSGTKQPGQNHMYSVYIHVQYFVC